LYCVGCEQFYEPGELPGGRCPEHGTPPQEVAEENWATTSSLVGERVDAALAGFDFRAAAGAVWEIVTEANRYIERVRPWELAKAGRDAELDGALAVLAGACRVLAGELAPLLPDAARRLARQCAGDRLPAPEPLFARHAV
jgi:methionyl-tRNA synthetase